MKITKLLIFVTGIEFKWTESYFPFTHPSWELEIKHEGKWFEVLGCGIMEQEILNRGKNILISHSHFLNTIKYYCRLPLIPTSLIFMLYCE